MYVWLAGLRRCPRTQAGLMDIAEPVGLVVDNLSKRYHGAKRDLFSGLSFDLSRGGRLAILGR